MTRAFVLMTAMPPTKGHINLIRFAASLAGEVHVFVCTQPGEPFEYARYLAVKKVTDKIDCGRVNAWHLRMETPQDPETPGFWELWKYIMTYPIDYINNFAERGVRPGDYIVSSEPYGKTLAELTGAKFMPYDPDREILYTKATDIRENPFAHFKDIAETFQHNINTRVVLFGAESTGKTTLARELADSMGGNFFFEWARPYLKTMGPEINKEVMYRIWQGQLALQKHSYDFYDKPVSFFDTDLFSTVGYWEQPHWNDALGEVPNQLISDAVNHKAELYIITRSNIPFEPEDIRYGGDKRESSDEYWIGVAEKYRLNYVVLDGSDLSERYSEATNSVMQAFNNKASQLSYDRGGF